MKKTLLISLTALVMLALAWGVWHLRQEKSEVEEQYHASQMAADSLRTRFDAALVSIAEIQDSLTVILPSETNVMHVSEDVERGGALTATRKNQVLRSISDLNESIQKSKEMIRRLEERLKERDIKVASLERFVANLKRSVTDRENMIKSLTQRVESLKGQVVSLQTDVETGRQQINDQQQVIEDKRRELSTIYYVIGRKKRLKELGVVTESGGVAGLGRSTKLSGMFPEGSFTRVDTGAQTTIPVPGKNATVLSGQSRASYQLVPLSIESAELRITDALEFRKVRYLVIQVQ